MVIKMTGRPPSSKKYHNAITLIVELGLRHRIEYGKVTAQGYPSSWLPGIVGQQITVIIGHKEELIRIKPTDEAYTCTVGNLGKISSVGKKNAGKEITIIYMVP